MRFPRLSPECAAWHTFTQNPLIADRPLVGHRSAMGNQHDDFEQAAQIVEAFSESETDEHVLDLLSRIAAALRDQAIDN
jgi:hypothetical protein